MRRVRFLEDLIRGMHFASLSGHVLLLQRRFEQEFPPGKKVSTSVDLPLSQQSKQVLAYGAEESDCAGAPYIGPEHLLLGLLRNPDTAAARALHDYDVTPEEVRKVQPPALADIFGRC